MSTSSVLPTGGGKALIDPSDTVILFARSPNGTVSDGKGHQCRRLAGKYCCAREAGDAPENPRHHDGIRAQWPEWTAHARNPSICATRDLRAA